jgi:hypothetical protein
MSSPADASSPPLAAIEALHRSEKPYLIGVRHHSPALSVALPGLLDGFRPEALLLELPPDFAAWLPWLADPGTTAPVALAGVSGDGGPAFYPFADFSPELVAIRWAARHGVPVVPCDLPLADRSWDDRTSSSGGPGVFLEALRAKATGRPDDDMWDRVVEARAPGAEPEAVRRAALAVGWALRADGEVAALDLRREAWMRRCLGEHAGIRVAVLVGAYHAPALLSGEADERPVPSGTVVTSLVPYTFGLLDARSGYPAGIRDPQWQQAILAAGGDPARIEAAAVESVVQVCVAVRTAGHPAGPAEAREAVRLASDLARLRALPAPGRGELVEALTSVIAHGEVLGRGRVVASAMERVMVGERRGVLAPGTPRSGLGPSVRDLLASLRLPGPGDPGREVRLDPLRSDLDRRREVTLHRLTACAVGYAEPAGETSGDTITSRWRLEWTPHTDAMLDVVGVRGVVLAQACEGTLREQRRRQEGAGGPTAGEVVAGLRDAAVCGLVALAAERLAEVGTVVPATGTLGETIGALALLDRLRMGHIAGVPTVSGIEEVAEALETAAVRQVDGLAGSQDPADARALAALAQRADTSGVHLRLADALDRLAAAGTPMIAAAAGAVQVLLRLAEPEVLGQRLASWVDGAGTPEARRDLRARLGGVLAVAEPLLHAGGAALASLLDRVESLPDNDFLGRLPALRGGFHVLSPAARDRLLDVVHERLGANLDVGTVDDPALLLARLLAEKAGLAALDALGLTPPSTVDSAPSTVDSPAAVPAGELSPADRWRLLLGRESSGLSAGAARYAKALDELYGTGRGEGSPADGAGRDTPFPNAREWSTELEALFGPGVREEVLAAAAESGRSDVAFLLDPDSVTPSVELLSTVLNLAGGMPESAVARLRPLVRRIVEELTRALAVRLRPALSGLTTPRPTYRPGGPLDLSRTVRANLATSRWGEDGRLVLVPEKPVFRTRARRGVDWRLILVVDVSGSMEASVIWSALTSAVLAGVPALTTHFVAFSTEVVDLTERVHDPLGLLLEVAVGGGTHIAAGLRYARSLVTVPARTLVVVVSDFEEGYPLGGLLGEVRALVESGCTLLGCASLDDQGRPRYSVSTAGRVVAAGMPVAALSPLELARWVGERVRP